MKTQSTKAIRLSVGVALGLHILLLLGLWSSQNNPRYTAHKSPTINIAFLAEASPATKQASPEADRSSQTSKPVEPKQQVTQKPAATTKTLKPTAKTLTTHKNKTPPALATKQQVAANFDALYQLLHNAINQNKHYPLVALRMHQQGKVRVSFKLFNNGNVDALQVAQSSGYHSLDKAALLAVKRIQPFQPAADYISQVKDFQLDIIFQL